LWGALAHLGKGIRLYPTLRRQRVADALHSRGQRAGSDVKQGLSADVATQAIAHAVDSTESCGAGDLATVLAITEAQEPDTIVITSATKCWSKGELLRRSGIGIHGADSVGKVTRREIAGRASGGAQLIGWQVMVRGVCESCSRKSVSSGTGVVRVRVSVTVIP
jgi:hypothetical protein